MPLANDPSTPDWLQRRRRLESILRLHAAVLAGDPAVSEAVHLLVDGLADPEVGIRELAAAALCEFGPDARIAIPELIRATQDSSEVVRRRAIRALGAIANPAESSEVLVPVLVAATEDLDDGVSLQAIATLGDFGPLAADALPALMSAVWTGDIRRRSLASAALIRIGTAAVPVVVQSLSYPSADVRSKAAYILGRIGTGAVDAIPNLLKLLNDSDAVVRDMAREAIRSIESNTK